jgi:hypothetical protein
MNDWRKDIEDSLMAFVTVAKLAGEPITFDEFNVEYLPAPHKQPSSLPKGKMAVYAFYWNNEWLKIGKVGMNSGPRYSSQHYTGNALSTLRGSLIKDPRMKSINGFNNQNPGEWIKKSTCRVNILLPMQRRKELLSLLEVFLQARLKPRYEG